jgi:sulfur carrier protein ThiS
VTRVVMIHDGRILRAGTLNEVLADRDGARRQIAVEVDGDPMPLLDWLAGQPDVLVIETVGERVVFSCGSEPESGSRLLRGAVAAGLAIRAWQPVRQRLDAVLRALTEEDRL